MSNTSKAKGCGHDAPALTVDEARARILETVTPVTATQRLPIRQALHRVLAETVTAAVDVPSHDNSAMDGFAVRAAGVPDAGTTLRLAGSSFAGHPFDGQVGAGECVRIMTGAVMPDGADTVIIQEHAQAQTECVTFDQAAEPGQHVRAAGEDLPSGGAVLQPGRYLRPADIGLLASVGTADVSVYARPRVAFFSTGDELRPVGEPLAPGQIYDSNRYTLHGMLAELSVEIHDMGVVPDTPEAVDRAFAEASEFDAIVTSGGVSVGEADYVVDALRRAGDVGYWNVSVKPGRPQAFGRVGQALFFGLPGNPVSVMVGFLQFVRPALVRLAGGYPAPHVQMPLPLTAPVRKKPGRCEYQRGRLIQGEDGMKVEPAGHQGSGVLRSMSAADCFIVLDIDATDAEAGEHVTVEPFAQPVWNG